MKVFFKPLSKEIDNAFIIDCKENPRVTIGRKNTNDIILPFRNVSSFHALVECVNEIIYVEDLNSTNGTFVNDEKIEGKVAIKNGDRVRFASYEFFVEFEDNGLSEPAGSEQIESGTVFMDVNKVQEIQEILNGETDEKELKNENEPAGKETVLYGVKGLVQNGRLILLDDKRNFLKEYELTEIETSIGRDEINNISIDHPSISRVHCFINRKENYYEIVDNDSTNGVFINDKKVKKALLKNGDIVKLGDKEFVYIAPGELFSPAFLKSSKKRQGIKFDKKKVYIGIFFIFFLIILLLALLPSEQRKGSTVQKISVKELKLNVINSFKNEDWDNVIYLIENFNLKGFENEYNKAKFEIKNRETYFSFLDSLNKNDFLEAKQKLSLIDKNSVYFKKGEIFLNNRKNEYITKTLEEIDMLMDDGKVIEAYNVVKKLKEKFPEDEKITKLSEDYEKRYTVFMKRKKARERYFAERRRINSKARLLINKARDLYLEGDIVEAISKLIDAKQLYIAKNLPVPSRITNLQEKLSKVRKLYLDGKKQVLQGNTELAAKNFEELFEISRKFLWKKDGKIENECKRLLKDYYKSKANAFYKESNFTKALEYSKRVLEIDPYDKEMQMLKREMLRTAKSLYNKGYIEQTQYNNCKSALYYYKQVIKILPPSDPVYKKAIKRIKQCEK